MPARYAAFVMPAGEPDRVQFIDLGGADSIDRKVSKFREAITGEMETSSAQQQDLVMPAPSRRLRGRQGRKLKLGRRSFPSSLDVCAREGRSLREALFDPLIENLKGRTQLFLAPDSELNRLPFEVLPTRDDSYVIDEYRISYLNTGRDALRLGSPPGNDVAAALVVADPDFDLSAATSQQVEPVPVQGRRSCDWSPNSFTFSRLPGTREEGKRIAALLHVQPHMESNALEGRLKASYSPLILHIATHGFFLADQTHESQGVFLDATLGHGGRLAQLLGQYLENPLLRSGLALAGVNTWNRGGTLPLEAEDGLLTAEDVSGLDLSATELVVLSACETGLGEIHVGEGVFGLRRAFVLAGAKTLVMSLWKVPDQQTRELMEGFYQRILQGQSRADALRQAQLDMKVKYKRSYYWGAFICQGNSSPLP